MPLLDQKTLQEFISTKNLYPKIEDIGKKYHLELGQMGYLSSEIRNAITGVIRPSNLIPRIVDQLEISPAQAEEIARDVNASIFSLIADHMQEINKGAKITVAPLEVKNITPTTPSDIIKTIEKPSEGSSSSINVLEHPAIAKMAPHELITAPQTTTTITTPTVTSNATKAVSTATVQPPVKKYDIDPYREPLT
jgi:hypothetical protein